jgi:hypothetical protein
MSHSKNWKVGLSQCIYLASSTILHIHAKWKGEVSKSCKYHVPNAANALANAMQNERF